MEKLLIKGGNHLKGKISCSGAKNAALPIIAASILSDEKIVLKNLPYLQDITTTVSYTHLRDNETGRKVV